MTILEIAQAAARRCKLPVIDSLVATENNSITFLESANKMARQISKKHEWSGTTIKASFTTVVDQQAYDVPTAFKEMLTTNLYNFTRQWAVPLETADRAEYYVSTGNQSWTDTRFRIINRQFVFTLPAESTDVMNYEYRTNAIAVLSSVYKTAFTANADEFLLDDELLITAIVADVLKTLGSEAAPSAEVDYKTLLAEEMASDGGKFSITTSEEHKKYPYPRNWNLVSND